MQLVTGGQTATNINGEIGPYFRNARGVRQGNPLSPILFDMVADALAMILERAQNAGHIQGLVPYLIPGGVSHLRYADDTIVMNQPDHLGIANLKFLLLCFEDMSGLNINFNKSEMVVSGVDQHKKVRIANLLNCKLSAFPIKYLGLPVSDRRLSLEDWGYCWNLLVFASGPLAKV